jgi:hypothetical protein
MGTGSLLGTFGSARLLERFNEEGLEILRETANRKSARIGEALG